MHNEIIKPFISEQDIKKRIEALAAQITNDYKGEALTLVCMLKGGVVFMADLARMLKLDSSLEFMEVSSYGDATQTSGVVRIVKDVSCDVTGKHVLLVEDIIDSGTTLAHIVKHLHTQNPKSLKVCVFLDKPDRRVNFDCKPDYTGFQIPDEFVVGYGLDYAQRYRNLPYLGILSFENEC